MRKSLKMRGRVSRTSLPSKRLSSSNAHPKPNRTKKRRGLDAFAIAERDEDSKKSGIRRSRLGEVEDVGPQRKRQRLAQDDDDEDLPKHSVSRNQQGTYGAAADQDELDVSGGSDSEGREWKFGQVDKNDDSDIDSDEAFGESDEEKFEGFSFGKKGSGAHGSTARKKKTNENLDSHNFHLDEADESEDEPGDDDDLGEDAVDLAAILDEDEQRNDDRGDASSASDEFDGFNEEQSEEDEHTENTDDASNDNSDDESFTSLPSDEESEQDGKDQQKQLNDIVTAFSKPTSNKNKKSEDPNRTVTVASALEALRKSSGLDPAFENEVRHLSRTLKSSKRDVRNDLVQAPLPKRQQDRIDQKAAYGKAKETLNRWIDTVKHNRRAEHLTFPLADPHRHAPQGSSVMIPTGQGKPRNELEQTIKAIMEQSGLDKNDHKHQEDQIKGFEDLQTNKMPLEEVMARRAELRKARELLFREEVRAKRIKKIKSKAFRRVHRKDVQKIAQKERDMLAAAGIDLSEDDKEAHDRRRAEERMGARHKESRWAKAVKKTGSAAWDEDARDGVTEMARRNEELRRRIEGKDGQMEGSIGSDASSGDEGSFSGEEEDNDDPSRKLIGQLEKASARDDVEDQKSGLASLKFMQRADAARKTRNDEEAEQLRRALAEEDFESDNESETQKHIGRMIFGPKKQTSEPKARNVERLEFEEPEESLDEDEPGNPNVEITRSSDDAGANKNPPQRPAIKVANVREGALSRQQAKVFTPETKGSIDSKGESPQSKPSSTDTVIPVKSGNMEGWHTISYQTDGESAVNKERFDSPQLHDPVVPSNLELVRSAFGGDNVEESFAAEKAAAESSEDEKVIDHALPGWGSWTGQGISKRERKRTEQRTKERYLTKQEGVKADNRKDKGMSKVIISEKRSKKNAKYLAPTLPHPFESRQQYERGIRQPIGPEWSTKETYQSSTKPRVLVKPGRLIEPMSTPML